MSQVSVIEALEALEISVPSRIPSHIPCPIETHLDDTASCYIQQSRWRCFGCGAGGDGVDLVRAVTGATYPQAVQFLSGLLDDLHERAPIEAPKPKEPVDLTYLFNMENERGTHTVRTLYEATAFVSERWPHLSMAQLLKWGVGVGPYSLLIPHYHPDGYVCGIKTRTFAGGNKGKKSAVPGSTYPQLYRVFDEPKKYASALLVEGESDTWTMTMSYGERFNVFGLPSGARSIKQAYIDELRTYGRVYVGLDGDNTGDEASVKVMSMLNDAGADAVRWRPMQGFKDWVECAVAGVL